MERKPFVIEFDDDAIPAAENKFWHIACALVNARMVRKFHPSDLVFHTVESSACLFPEHEAWCKGEFLLVRINKYHDSGFKIRRVAGGIEVWPWQAIARPPIGKGLTLPPPRYRRGY